MSKPTLDLREIFSRAMEIDSPSERERYLNQACGDDLALRDDVESLLRASENLGRFLATPLVSGTAAPEPECAEISGTVIGPYTLLQQIGEGGMGAVYMAKQSRPIRRKVALKIIKPGMDSRQVIARFEAERQALALMDHPNIARVLDAGTTGTGRPYFVMELVNGIPITEYCDRQQCSPRERLELMVPVCLAIQHAHQKGIIHRDIKPSNVLVSSYDGKPVPKVIDFGVAKAIEQRLTDLTLYTEFGAIVGTFDYMSPEQAENSALDIDTRSDIYALGVLLYELMTGTTPLERHRLKRPGLEEIRRCIREDDAPNMFTRLSRTERLATIAAQRKMQPEKLMRLLRGEIDWIAMKALEKDRARRYATANALARDIQRYLSDEPVEAGPPSASYRMRKLAHRHRLALAFAGSVAAVLVAATSVSSWQAIRATREEQRAREMEAEAKSVLQFFRDKVLAADRPRHQEGGLGRAVTLRDAIDGAEPSIGTDFATQPRLEAAIRHTLGASYQYLGEPSLAIHQLEKAMALRSALLGPEAPETLESANDLGVAYRAAGRTDEAIRILEKSLSQRKRYPGPDHPDTQTTINNLAVAYHAAGRAVDAIPLHELELRYTRAKLGPDHPETLISLNNLGSAYLTAGRHADSLPLLEETLARREAALPSGHPDLLTSRNNLAAAYEIAGRHLDSIPIFERVLATRRETLGPDHPDTLKTLNNLAVANHESGRRSVALPMFEDLLRLREAKLGRDHPATLGAMSGLATSYLAARRWGDAEALLRDSLARREKSQPDEWHRFHAMSDLGAALAAQGKVAEAEPLLIGGYEGMKAREPRIPAHRKRDLRTAATRIVVYYETRGRPEQASAWRGKLGVSASPEPSESGVGERPGGPTGCSNMRVPNGV